MDELKLPGVKPEDMEFTGKQVCLRCNKVPALKDGSDEGEYYCQSCIDYRKEVDNKNKQFSKDNEDKLKLPKKEKSKDQKILWVDNENGDDVPELDFS